MGEKSLKKNAVVNFIKAFMNVIFPIISFPYASRILLPEGTGKVNFANSLIENFVLIASLGITVYSAREASKIRNDRAKVSQFCREIFTINMISTLVSYILLASCFLFSQKFRDYKVLIIISSAKILFSTLGMEWLYNAYEEFTYITLRQTAFQILSLIALFTLVKEKSDYTIYACIGVFANVGSYALNFIHSRKYIDLFKRSKLDLKRHLKPILTFFSISLAGKINGTLDTIMLGFLLSAEACGLYNASTKITGLVSAIITSVIFSFMPRSSYYIEQGKKEEYHKLLSRVFNVTYFFSIPTAFGLYFLCESLLLAFTGKEFMAALPCMRVMTVNIVFIATNSYLSNLIITPNRMEKFFLYAQGIGVFVNIVLNAFLIKLMGVVGAGIATVMVDFTLAFVILIPSLKYIKARDNVIGLLKALMASCLMYLVLKVSLNNLHNPFIKIVIGGLEGVLIYALITVIIRHPSSMIVLESVKNKIKRIK